MLHRTLLSTTMVILVGSCDAFTISRTTPKSTSSLQMGLFDGVREAFIAQPLEQTSVDKERETPIDRWMGWSVVSENEQATQQAVAADYIDSMDESNYVIVELPKPMGIVFEENDADHGGIFVQSIKEDGAAFQVGNIKEGDQLIAVNKNKVSGMPFDDALGTIVDANDPKTKLVFFRGSAKQFYGPTGASQKWLDEFIGVVDPSPKTTTETVEVTSEATEEKA